MNATQTLPLFGRFPGLEERIPRIPLGVYPTQATELPSLARRLGIGRLYIKRDDLTAPVYGGNKVRKLEFLLALAKQKGADEVITIGFAGSNHALATAIYARQLGMKCVAMLLPQLNANYVRRNLLADLHFGAELIHCSNGLSLRAAILARMAGGLLRSGRLPVFIPAGGSSPAGVIGYVNAAFELADQITAGVLPEPDRVYLPLGSAGTAAGLQLGFRQLGLKTEIMAVRVIEERLTPDSRVHNLARDTARLLHRQDPGFPVPADLRQRLCIRNDCMGPDYARLTESGARATELLQGETGIPLNGAYSAKAFGALLDDAAQGLLQNRTVLFWNTYNSADLPGLTSNVDYRDLPAAFHQYFEQDLQQLDRP